MTRPTVFVILVNYNSGHFLKNCLEALEDQTYKNFQTVIIDNASTDQSMQKAKADKIIKNRANLGFPAAVNQGVRHALKNGTEDIVLLGCDTQVEKTWLEELIKTAQRFPQAGIIQSKIIYYPSGKIQSLGNKIHLLGFGYTCPQVQKKIDYASGTAMLIKKAVFGKIGLFDERIMFLEDLDFGWRARRAGFVIKLAPKSIVYHHYNFSRYQKKFYYIERGRKLVLLKNLSFSQFLLRLPVLLLAEPVIFACALFSGWFFDKIRAEVYFWKNLK